MNEIPLRAHHLLCILTYRGYGYGDEFVKNFDAIVTRINAGTPIQVVRGPDAICAPLCQAKTRHDFHCDEMSSYARDDHAAATLRPILGDGIIDGREPVILDTAKVAFLRQEYAAERIRAACAGCQWHAFCTEIAQTGFADTKLQPIAPPV